MKTTATAAALLSALSLGLSVTPAFAGGDSDLDVGVDASAVGTACVSDASYARLAVGQRLSYVRAVVGDTAQVSLRHWTVGANRFQERLYPMCTPVDDEHDMLTTRFQYYEGAWRALVVDTHIGPEQ